MCDIFMFCDLHPSVLLFCLTTKQNYSKKGMFFLRFGWLLVFSLYKEDYLQLLKCMSFWLHGCCIGWEGWDPGNRFNYTSWVAIVKPADRPKSVRNRYVIEFLVAFFALSRSFWDISVGVGAFVIGLSQISSFFSFCHTTESDLFLFSYRKHTMYILPIYFRK